MRLFTRELCEGEEKKSKIDARELFTCCFGVAKHKMFPEEKTKTLNFVLNLKNEHPQPTSELKSSSHRDEM